MEYKPKESKEIAQILTRETKKQKIKKQERKMEASQRIYIISLIVIS